MWIVSGTNLFHEFGNRPPSVAIEPSSAEMRTSVRVICQPPRLAATAERHVCEENRVPAWATVSAISASVAASMPDSWAAYSKVNSA